jgi:C2 domain
MPPKAKKEAKKDENGKKEDLNSKDDKKDLLGSGPLGDLPANLVMKCRKLRDKDTLYAGDKSDAKLIVYQRSSVTGKWTKVGETEVVKDSLCPEFKKTFLFSMDAKTLLRFECYDEDETRTGSRFEQIGIAHVELRSLIENINAEVSFPMRPEKSTSFAGELILTLKTTEDLSCLETRAKILAEEGFDIKKDAEIKRQVTKKVNSYVEESCLPMAFKLILAEIVSKKVPAEEVYVYAAKRLREIGEQVNKIVRSFLY